jgi:hypothetical protein
MSLRIIIKSAQIGGWISERGGRPARRRDTDDDLAVLFDGDKADFETLSIDEFIEVMKANHQVLLVDQEAGKTFHKFVQHG